ncbi:MAG TPA: endonuclease domain-containing protein [Dehalococcoidia bacterium]|nr:endonuclease domain-containing protein [Dehalococcoidia bacterium]
MDGAGGEGACAGLRAVDVGALTPWPPLPRGGEGESERTGQGRWMAGSIGSTKLADERTAKPVASNRLRVATRRERQQKTKQAARDLRRRATPAEALLWQALRNRQLDGRKFRRQQVIGPFVVDFYCAEERLVVEVDGAIHDEPSQAALDAARQQVLEDLEMRFVRLPNDLVVRDLPTALARICAAFRTRAVTQPQPPPLPPRERGPGGEGLPNVHRPQHPTEKDQLTCH